MKFRLIASAVIILCILAALVVAQEEGGSSFGSTVPAEDNGQGIRLN